jgi:oligosaccharyltransferase complex subunit alpha (ribophorin I)
LEAQATSTLKVTSIYTRTMTPYPVTIHQSEGQLVRYRDNHYFFSPYTVLSQDTKVQLPSVKVAAYSKQKPALLKGDRLTYGPYLEIAPFTHSNMTVHFENNSPFVAITSLVKEYEISQWGNLAVEETYQVVHEGARFVGAFNRFEFQRLGAPSSVNNILRTLPHSAADIYYRDAIGNISTSHVSNNKDGSVKLEITPRFPLFGGWNIAYYLGFNLPLSQFLFSNQDDSSQLVLNVTYAINTPSLFIEDYTLRIILPEGATDIKPVIPFAVDGITNESHFTYLDFTGRPVVVIKKRNVVNEHDQPIYVLYRFSKINMLQEPILLITAIFVILFSFILISRIDLSVTYKNPEEKKEVVEPAKEEKKEKKTSGRK